MYTDFRPTPLQHYVFPIGGSGLYLVVDENGQFREDNFAKLQDSFAKQNNQLDGRKGGGPKASGRIAKGGSASGNSDIYRIVKVDRHSHSSILCMIFFGLVCFLNLPVRMCMELSNVMYAVFKEP